MRKTPSVVSSSKMERIACTVASHPTSWPVQSWRDQTADWMSVLVTAHCQTARKSVTHVHRRYRNHWTQTKYINICTRQRTQPVAEKVPYMWPKFQTLDSTCTLTEVCKGENVRVTVADRDTSWRTPASLRSRWWSPN